MTDIYLLLSVLEELSREANFRYPLETGGVLLGVTQQNAVQISDVVGPGPKARHARYSFQPDDVWQNEQIANLYETSGRELEYLGDWHTHPDASNPNLSRLDRLRLKQISRYRYARQPNPLMGILFGRPEYWDFAVHVIAPARAWFWEPLPRTAQVSWAVSRPLT